MSRKVHGAGLTYPYFFFSTLSFHKSFAKGLWVRHKPKTKFGSQFNTNNAREYFYYVQSEYLFKHGIIQISSCVNTPQQNGVDERKIRHFPEVAQSLMFSIGVPKYLWGEAIITSAYLINSLPSCVLKFETPRQALIKLFPHAHVLSSNLPFKIFGCSIFVHVHPQNRSKLDPQSIKCVFIGYSTYKKGYECFCSNTRRVFETMDVTFFEQNPYFSQT